MTSGDLHNEIARSLSKRESRIVAWLEEERPALVSAADISETFGLSPSQAADVVRRMATKGWLNRVAQGSYEPLLADSGGIALPNPWGALASWKTPYYVSYASAAYEYGLTPDRPGAVQTCVKKGTRIPSRFAELPLTLLPQQEFSLEGTEPREIRGYRVCFATPERTLLESAMRPSRVGGAIALARIVSRAGAETDWPRWTELAAKHARGHPAARRIAALMSVLDLEVPGSLREFATERLPAHPALLDDRSIYGKGGTVLREYAIVVNVPEESLREEIRR